MFFFAASSRKYSRSVSVEGSGVQEKRVWDGAPSQVVNLGVFLVCALTFWLVVPLFYAVWKWLEVRSVRYELTTERLRVSWGVFTRRTEEVELYRVKDTSLVEPFFQRIFDLGSIHVITSDASTPNYLLEALPQATDLREHIRHYVEVRRNQLRVRETDVSHPAAW